MPLISIKALPFEPYIEIDSVLKSLSEQIATQCKIGREHIMITWEWLSHEHYVHQGAVVDNQQQQSHPVLIELVAPNYYSHENIIFLMELIAVDISSNLPIHQNNVFISYTPAYSDGIYDQGHVINWEDNE
ncbi:MULTISPECIES: hypothetical protein [unclassified Photobacterium]|uniref:hypothetical protein n=1 Tax=unclassified Photobacterium TaxID=2628852 RepID=UPI001EDF3C29|nr:MULTISPECIES: hypothetical protein [unclassified Photobacterium]MCG3863760.1 hypothetical protein [Photobacterium sp. Ph6]MCG3875290.1 hypothetical protein [Photobacterium sp. Ph5]